MLVHHNTRRMQWFRLTQRFDNDPAGVKFVLAFDLSLRYARVQGISPKK
ncbi:hypothetical protein [Enterobacter hormaechei]|nr:hypothetical protein [Enterobacter hormaechei]